MLRGGFKAIHGDLLHIRFREKIRKIGERGKVSISSFIKMVAYGYGLVAAVSCDACTFAPD